MTPRLWFITRAPTSETTTNDICSTEVAIPRVARPERLTAKIPVRQKDRVQRACRNCHKRKIKCSGNLPRCEYCEKYGRQCVYDNSRRDRLVIATSHNGRLRSLLRGLSDRVSANDKSLIDSVLNESEADDDDSSLPGPSEPLSRISTSQSQDELPSRPQTPLSTTLFSQSTEDNWHAFTDGSNPENRDIQDIYGSGGETGQSTDVDTAFTCNICEESWLVDLRRRLSPQNPSLLASNTSPGFYLDFQHISLPDPGNPFTLPDELTTRFLFEPYLKTVHRSFSLISIRLYRQVLAYYHSAQNHQVISISERWYAIVNLVLAIGARYVQHTNYDRYGHPNDEAVFLSRAFQLLGFNESTIVLSDPEPLLVQATGLLAFYYMSTGYVQRAWIMISTSLRLAIALGMHQDQQSQQSPDQTQLWWGLHNLESLLCSMIGRPGTIRLEDITTPFPSDVGQSQSDDVSPKALDVAFQEKQVLYAIISQRVLSGLYMERRAPRSWGYVHSTIASLMAGLDDWAVEAMPRHLQGSDVDPRLEIQQLQLKKYYHQLKVLITRPSLRRIEECVEAGSDRFTPFDQSWAEVCIQTASEDVDLLPDEIDIRLLYTRSTWWSITHNLMQVASILLIAISLRTHFPTLATQSISSFRKLTLWLQAIRPTNAIADRAYCFLHDVVRSASPNVWPEVLDLFPDEEVVMLQPQPMSPAALSTEEFEMSWHG